MKSSIDTQPTMQWKTCRLCQQQAFCFVTHSVTMTWINAGLGEQKCTWHCENCHPNGKLATDAFLEHHKDPSFNESYLI